MRKNSRNLEIRILLPSNFKEKINSLMNEEMIIASSKWGVNLDEEKINIIKINSIKQLISKVNFICNSVWDYENSDYLPLKVAVPHIKEEYIFLNDEIYEEYNYLLFYRSNDGWRITKEPSEKTIPIDELSKIILSDIYKWITTAVFYGVGSYS